MKKQTASLRYLHPHEMKMVLSDTDTLSISVSVSTKHLKNNQQLLWFLEGALLFWLKKENFYFARKTKSASSYCFLN